MKEALQWKSLDGGKVECRLCSHRCKIVDGASGICTVRRNQGGRLMATSYGKVSSMGPDPIEKKPLYHFMPGTRAFSLGGVGCNFRCDYCQNWSISQDYSSRGLRQVQPDEVPVLALKNGCQSISWTYNEPAIWHEFALDSSKLAKTAGLATTYVTNGYITEEALREISPYLDAANVDVKGFTEEFYKRRCQAKLQPVLDTCVLALELGIFIEVTYLIIPTQNDTPDEIKRFCEWVRDSLGPDLPVHFSRFHPDFNYRDAPRTPMETMTMAYRAAKEAGLNFVYLGNIPHCDEENTICPECGTLAIERAGFFVNRDVSRDGKCGQCGRGLNVVTEIP